MPNISYDYAVFGGNGQDGFFITRYLLKNNFSVIAVCRKKIGYLDDLKKIYKKKLKIFIVNIYNFENFKKIFRNSIVKKILFCAGFSKIPSSDAEKKLCYNANYKIFSLLLEFIESSKLSLKILYISSSEIFGSDQKKLKNENSKLKSSNFYGYCKLLTYDLIKEYRIKHSFFISTAIAYNHESIISPEHHIIKNFIRKFSTSKRKKITIYNPGEYRNISHVYDFLPLFIKVLNYKKTDDFIFANDQNYKIIDIANKINKLLYSNKFKILQKTNNNSMVSRKADNSKIKRIFNYKPKYDINKILIRFNSYQKKKKINGYQ